RRPSVGNSPSMRAKRGRCGREESNLQGARAPPGPKPGASASSATPAGPASLALRGNCLDGAENAYDHARGRRVGMRRIGLIALFVTIAAMAATVATTAALRPSAASCGGILWEMKTFSDPQRLRVRTTPRLTTIADIGQRPFPSPLP